MDKEAERVDTQRNSWPNTYTHTYKTVDKLLQARMQLTNADAYIHK